ncbi:MAG: hypothetical protein JW797_17970 [Bradymonadales bacterium]|nr:hypothetical protein [Bradymonadales bacterium]
MSGCLTIVGLGPAQASLASVQARQELRSAAMRGARAYGLPHTRDIARALEPNLEIRAVDYVYHTPGVDRPTGYRDLAQMLLRKAFEEERDVLYLVAGSPLFYNDAVLLIRRACATKGHPLRMVHGMSFVDLVLDRVFWTGHNGLQLYSAWNVVFDGIVPAQSVPLLLCQIGEFSRGGEAIEESQSVDMLVKLRDTLLGWYPPDHPVIVLYSSGHPDYRSLSRRLPLQELAGEPVPVYSNLWVPALDGPPLEADMAPENAV